jgi:hypothetical protein
MLVEHLDAIGRHLGATNRDFVIGPGMGHLPGYLPHRGDSPATAATAPPAPTGNGGHGNGGHGNGATEMAATEPRPSANRRDPNILRAAAEILSLIER